LDWIILIHHRDVNSDLGKRHFQSRAEIFLLLYKLHVKVLFLSDTFFPVVGMGGTYIRSMSGLHSCVGLIKFVIVIALLVRFVKVCSGDFGMKVSFARTYME
jgi:hypothetical protein